jgi:hypothetical protein
MGVVCGVTILDNAYPAHLHYARRSGVPGLEKASIMHLAIVAPPVERPLASFDLAVRLHSAEGTAPVGQ